MGGQRSRVAAGAGTGTGTRGKGVPAYRGRAPAHARGGTTVSSPRERRMRVGSFQTRALELEGDGPVHVLLHGYADSADTWRPVLTRLGRAGRAAVAFDLPGFADAQPLAEDEPVLEQITAFTLAAVRHVAAEGREVVLVGNSLGAIAALLASAEDARAVAGVVAIAPAGFDMGGWIYRLETYSLLQLALRLPPLVPPVVLRGIVALVYRRLTICEQGAVSDETVNAFAQRLSDRSTLRRSLGVARRLTPELSRPAELNGVDVPVLVVWGREDRMLSHRNAELVQQLIPHARVVTLDRCGHCPQVERPSRTTELILSLLPAGARARR